MKRILAIILAGLMLLSLAACGGKDEGVTKVGLLTLQGQNEEYNNHVAIAHSNGMDGFEHCFYNNLSTALMDLKNGNIALINSEKSMAEYVVARNPEFELISSDDEKSLGLFEVHFSMMTMDSNKEVYDILNNAIKDMKADGTLDSLIANELKAYIESDPEAKDLPKFDGARTIKIGVTGDVPPMDFVASNGKAAGFNIALLTEIANRAQVNFELVQIESGSRPMALSSGKVDAVFWTKGVYCLECKELRTEDVQGTLVTESYFADAPAAIKLKSDK